MTQPDQAPVTPGPEINRDVLNNVTRAALAAGALFGRGLELTADDRGQLNLVADTAAAILEPSYQDPAWGRFQALVTEGGDKGVLQAMATHPGTRVPTWCIDGGQDAAVKKVRLAENNRPAIEVPTGIYNLYHWTLTVDSLRGYARTSDEGLRGRSAAPMGRDLQHLAHLLKESGSLPSREDRHS